MSVETYIKSTKAKNAVLFRTKKIIISTSTLEHLLRHAYDSGYMSGVGDQKFTTDFGDLWNDFMSGKVKTS